MKNKWLQRLDDNVDGNWQRFTAMMYDIYKLMNLKKKNRKPLLKKEILNL